MNKWLIVGLLLLPAAYAQTPVAVPLAPAEASATVDWYPMGDVNGDGKADGLIWISTPTTEVAIVAAGPLMEDVIWSSSAIFGSPRSYDMIDHTGDGIIDLVTRAVYSQNSGGGQCVEFACQYEYEGAWNYEYSLYDGKTGKSAGAIKFSEPRTETGISLRPTGGRLDLSAEQDAWSWATLVGPGQYWGERNNQAGAEAYAVTPAVVERVGESIQSQEFTFKTFSGQSTSKAFDGITDFAGFQGAYADLNGDAKADLIVDHGVPVRIPDMGVLRPVLKLTAYSASDASEIWTADLPSGELEGYTLSFGDLNDDGVADIQHLGFNVDEKMTWNAFNGKNGASLGAANTGTSLQAAIPWQDVDGDGKSEHLFLIIDETSQDDLFGLELRTQSGSVLWAIAPGNEFPISLEEALEGGRAITDLTGDGISDLVFSTFDPDATYWGGKDLKLVDGATGKTVYEIAAGASFWHQTIGDLTGDGLDDIISLIPLSASGKQVESSAAGMRLDVRRGSDGELAWTRVLMDQNLKGTRSVAGLDGVMFRAGDVDGDGRQDIGVKIDAGNWWMLDDPNDRPSNPVNQNYVLSGSTGKILWMAPTLDANGTLVSYTQDELAKLVETPPSPGAKLPKSQPAYEISQPSAGQAYAPTEGPEFENQPSKESPGAGLGLMLLAVALMAARRRL